MVRERAISWIEKSLNGETHIGKNKKTTFTEKEVKKIIEKADIEVSKKKKETITSSTVQVQVAP